MEETLLVQIVVLIGYVFTAIYQSKRIKSLEDNFKSQENLLKNQIDTIKTFEDYKKMINLSDVEKNISLKLDNQALEMENKWKLREKKLADTLMKS